MAVAVTVDPGCGPLGPLGEGLGISTEGRERGRALIPNPQHDPEQEPGTA